MSEKYDGAEQEATPIDLIEQRGVTVRIVYADGMEIISSTFENRECARECVAQQARLKTPRDSLLRLFNWCLVKAATTPLKEEQEEMSVLFKIEKKPREDVCAAMRCMEPPVVRGAATLWDRAGEHIGVCQHHADKLDKMNESAGLPASSALFRESPRSAEEPRERTEVISKVVVSNVERAATSFAQTVLTETQDALLFLKDFKPDTQEQLQLVADLMNESREKLKKIEEAKKKVTKPISELLNESRALFKPVEKKLEDLITATKTIIAKAKMDEAGRNRDLMRLSVAAQDAGDTPKATYALAQMQTSTELEGVASYQKWDYEVFGDLPLEWCVPNHKLLREHCNHSTDREPAPVRGVKFFAKLPTVVGRG